LLASIVTILQAIGTFDFWHLVILPVYNFLTISISIYVVLVIVAIIIVFYFLFRIIKNRSNILDTEYGRSIAIICQTPRTTRYLRDIFEDWVRHSDYAGGLTFDEYMKSLQKEGYLKYRDGKWKVEDKALDYIEKYHGG
jgi:hypothetical protein